MKKTIVVVFVLTLALTLSSFAFAGENKLAFFKIDSDIATEGFQGGSFVNGIDGGDRVGFAVYVKNVDELRTCSIDVTWESSKATLASETGKSIDIDDRNVNGVDVSLSEDSVVAFLDIVDINEAGHYKVDLAKDGPGALSTTEYGLVYVLVLKTETSFTVNDDMVISVKVSLQNESQHEKDLGERLFYVNSGVSVKTSTWGEIKKQFKD